MNITVEDLLNNIDNKQKELDSNEQALEKLANTLKGFNK